MAPVILLVEDEINTRLSMDIVLKKAGYTVVTADCLCSALQGFAAGKHDREEIDLLIIDLLLPDTSGSAWLETIRNFVDNLPVIVISGYLDRETIVRLKAGGCQTLLEKPFDAAKLLDTVRSVLRQSKNI